MGSDADDEKPPCGGNETHREAWDERHTARKRSEGPRRARPRSTTAKASKERVWALSGRTR